MLFHNTTITQGLIILILWHSTALLNLVGQMSLQDHEMSKRCWMNVEKMLNERQKDVEWMSKRCWMNVKKMLNERQKDVEWSSKRCWMNAKKMLNERQKMLNECKKDVEWTSKRCWMNVKKMLNVNNNYQITCKQHKLGTQNPDCLISISKEGTFNLRCLIGLFQLLNQGLWNYDEGYRLNKSAD